MNLTPFLIRRDEAKSFRLVPVGDAAEVAHGCQTLTRVRDTAGCVSVGQGPPYDSNVGRAQPALRALRLQCRAGSSPPYASYAGHVRQHLVYPAAMST